MRTILELVGCSACRKAGHDEGSNECNAAERTHESTKCGPKRARQYSSRGGQEEPAAPHKRLIAVEVA
jgi:hypothetical protein